MSQTTQIYLEDPSIDSKQSQTQKNLKKIISTKNLGNRLTSDTVAMQSIVGTGQNQLVQ